MKYVILEDDAGGKWPFLFPDTLAHSDVANLLQRLIPAPTVPYSAGFWGDKTAHGHSDSLGLKPPPGDEAYILLGLPVSHLPPSTASVFLKKYLEISNNS